MSENPALSFTLDHVELFVPDRGQAAEWYGHHLEVTTYEAEVVRGHDGGPG